MIQGNVGMKTETKDMKWHTRLMGLIFAIFLILLSVAGIYQNRHNPGEIFYLEWIGIVLGVFIGIIFDAANGNL